MSRSPNFNLALSLLEELKDQLREEESFFKAEKASIIKFLLKDEFPAQETISESMKELIQSEIASAMAKVDPFSIENLNELIEDKISDSFSNLGLGEIRQDMLNSISGAIDNIDLNDFGEFQDLKDSVDAIGDVDADQIERNVISEIIGRLSH